MEQEDDRKPSAKETTTSSPPSGGGGADVGVCGSTAGRAGATSGSPASPSSPGRKAVKPALKKDGDQSKQKRRSDKEKKHLKWDEEAIEEHDQLRGTRMKIDEPNTPYTHYDSGAESDDSRARPKSPANQKATLSWDVLETKLNSVAAVREQYYPPSSPSSHGGGGHSSDGGGGSGGPMFEEGEDTRTDEDKKRDEMRRLEFKEHRKRHYNEMELVRKFRQEHPEGLLEADNGDEDIDDGDVADTED